MMMKRKATHAELRIESKTHQGWFKYDVTIQNVDGSVESIHAYGKDLQDALRRVVHDENISKVELKTKRIPDLFWVLILFYFCLILPKPHFRILASRDREKQKLACVTIRLFWVLLRSFES